MGLSIPYPITHKELLDEKYYWKGIEKIYIDCAEYLIKRIIKNIEVDTMVFDDYREV